MTGIDEDNVAARTYGPERVGRRSRPQILLCVEPPQKAIVRTMGARGRCRLYIGCRDDLTLAPLPAPQPEQTKPRHIEAANPDSAAPACSAADRRHSFTVDVHVGIGIRYPLPRRRGANRIHHFVAEDIRNRSLEKS